MTNGAADCCGRSSWCFSFLPRELGKKKHLPVVLALLVNIIAFFLSTTSPPFVDRMGAKAAVAKNLEEDSCERRPPLILGLGRGTTGTRTMHSAVCRLGLPSVHFALSCLPKNTTREESAGYLQHRKVHHIFWKLIGCLRSTVSGTCPEPDQWTERLMNETDKMIVATDVDAIHDTPYPFMASYLVSRAAELRGSQHSVILLTLRDPAAWAPRRTTKHAADRIPICRDVLSEFSLFQTKDSPTGKWVDYFDVFECIKRYNNKKDQQQRQLSSPTSSSLTSSSGSLRDMFMTSDKLIDAEDGLEALIFAMDNYQNLYGSLATYRIDMFDQEEEIDEKDIVKEIQPLLRKTGHVVSAHQKLYDIRIGFKEDKERYPMIFPVE